jgi:hypothetical protein
VAACDLHLHDGAAREVHAVVDPRAFPELPEDGGGQADQRNREPLMM